MLEKLLKIGLNQTEAEIYIVLLENSRLTPANISKMTGINRTTVYAAASELLKKGIIEEDLSGKTKYFVAMSPEGLANYTERQIKEIKEKERIIKEIMPDLEMIPKSKNFSVPKIQFINGNDVEEFMYKKSPVWEKSMRDMKETTWWGFQDHNLLEIDKYRKWVLWYWKQAKEDIDLKLFSNQSDIEEEMTKRKITRRQLKYWKGNSFTSTQWILGEYIVSVVTREKIHYLVQIRDRVLADSMRNLAKELWNRD